MNREPTAKYCHRCGILFDIDDNFCPKCKKDGDEETVYVLQKGDEVYSTGAYLQWNGTCFIYGGSDDTIYFDGVEINEAVPIDDDNDKPFISCKD